jgi:hypothetical protein
MIALPVNNSTAYKSTLQLKNAPSGCWRHPSLPIIRQPFLHIPSFLASTQLSRDLPTYDIITIRPWLHLEISQLQGLRDRETKTQVWASPTHAICKRKDGSALGIERRL